MTQQTSTITQQMIMPPCDDEAERAVIGSCLIDNDALLRVMSEIEPADFYTVKHQWIYEAIIRLYRARQNIDILTVRAELDRAKQTDEIGGPAYLSELMLNTPSSIYAQSYAQIIKRKAIRRKMLKTASELAQMAYNESEDEYAQLSAARSKIADITIPGAYTETSAQVASRGYDQMIEAYANPLKPGEVRGLASGLIDFDILLGGVTPQRLIVLAGRPGMGKSSLVHQHAYMLAEKSAARVAIFSLEMSNDEVNRRQKSRLSGVPYENLESGMMTAEQIEDATKAFERLSNIDLYIDDNSEPTMSYIESVVIKHGPFDLVIIDHLGLIYEVQHAQKGELVNVIGRVTRACKVMAKERNTCVMLLAQLSRKCEERDDKRPILPDLRDSGRIEEDADEVYAIYRDGYYNPESDTPNTCEIIRRKGRNKSQRSACDLFWHGPTMSFKNMVKREVKL